MSNIVCKGLKIFLKGNKCNDAKKTLESYLYIFTWSGASAVLSTEQTNLPSSLCNVEEKTTLFSLFSFWDTSKTRKLKTGAFRER